MEEIEELATLVLEVGVRFQSNSTELVLEVSQSLYDDVEDVRLLDDAVSSSQSQSQLLLLLLITEDAVVVSSDGVDSTLVVLSWDQELVVIALE